MTTFTTNVWYSNGTTYTWPEQQAGVQPNVGICFPGGGTRALCATMGQLRALISFGFLQNVDYISCVSGGSWASAAFTYYNAGATSDAEFLGPITDPANITLDELSNVPTSSLGWGATQNLGDALDAADHAGVPHDLLWAAAIGQLFFARFGLYDPNNPSYFSLDAASVAGIKAANPALADANFHVVREPSDYKLPYLLINATIDGPTKTAPYSPDRLVMVTYSPLYSGIPFQQTVVYPIAKSWSTGAKIDALVGGGFIESFAWGCDAPTVPATDGAVSVDAPASVFGLVNASGTSSSAFAAIFEKIKALDGLLPEQNYWPPVASATQPAAQLFDFGDGGNLENYGLIPLIMRGLKKVIVFVNTETPLSLDYDPTTGTADEKDLDANFPPLFGIPVTSSFGNAGPDYNQVFPSTDYAPLVQELQALKKAGQPMVVAKTHTIQANPFWGVPAGATIDILYVYLDKVSVWESQIKDDWVKLQLDLGDTGEFPHFPNYKTIDENIIDPFSLTEYTPRQVNLLADLTCWVVLNSRSTIESFIA
ncbi:MAG TPA: hypothetical protein VGQ76_17250 [Thermoanaerobaculia bacterium]|nr:hypothetical protein [Thermoanaerobaculia bacterium]